MEQGSEKSGWIKQEKAILYLKNLSENPSIRDNYKRSLGRILNAEIFKNWYLSEDFGGIMAWFVAEKKGGVQFLAFEKKQSNFNYLRLSDEEINHLRPAVDDIYFTTKGFSKGVGQPGYDFGRYLRIQSNVGDPINYFKDKEKLNSWIENYRENKVLYRHHSVSHGYLINNWKGEDYFGKFLFQQKREVKYIRYFFGFDPSEAFDRIRFFLVPVDENGKNIINDDGGVSIFDGGNFLQTSWPPKPSI